jgi:hypothetical protein
MAQMKRSIENAHAELDKCALIRKRDVTHQGLGPRIKAVVARSNRQEDKIKMLREALESIPVEFDSAYWTYRKNILEKTK